MQTNHPMFDEFAKLMTTATGLAQTASEEARAVMRAQAERLVAELDLVRRSDLEGIEQRLAKLEQQLAASAPAKAKPTSDQTSPKTRARLRRPAAQT